MVVKKKTIIRETYLKNVDIELNCSNTKICKEGEIILFSFRKHQPTEKDATHTQYANKGWSNLKPYKPWKRMKQFKRENQTAWPKLHQYKSMTDSKHLTATGPHSPGLGNPHKNTFVCKLLRRTSNLTKRGGIFASLPSQHRNKW